MAPVSGISRALQLSPGMDLAPLATEAKCADAYVVPVLNCALTTIQAHHTFARTVLDLADRAVDVRVSEAHF